ncbi:hypothetical protein LSTR_LSTR005278 [Laodelphax striatellus]|uniref:Uncharacterized protein n=1 Tax=Laodelphax striatellus TaxID=195883 RepID=A0A482X803_LAOST|nr:hypothetical protein LSTR_LSTR015179 [Laodelphax striatellus]RZF41816.1 hypothetical protein LSTR_LSTR005278 [Laodelphax striatellus]
MRIGGVRSFEAQQQNFFSGLSFINRKTERRGFYDSSHPLFLPLPFFIVILKSFSNPLSVDSPLPLSRLPSSSTRNIPNATIANTGTSTLQQETVNGNCFTEETSPEF